LKSLAIPAGFEPPNRFNGLAV